MLWTKKVFMLFLVFILISTQVPFYSFAAERTEQQVSNIADFMEPTTFHADDMSNLLLVPNSETTVLLWGIQFVGSGVSDSVILTSPNQLSPQTNMKGFAKSNGYNYDKGFIKKDGTLQIYGPNKFGTLGNGTRVGSYMSPKTVTGVSNVQNASIESHVIVVTKDKKAWTWGNNANLQLGPRKGVSLLVPSEVIDLSDVVQAQAGSTYSVVLKTDGTVWTFGEDQINNNKNLTKPTQIEGLTDIIQISTVHDHNLALKKDGTVWTWGKGPYSRKVNNKNPVKIMGLYGIESIYAGGNFGMAKDSLSRVWGWGFNAEGELAEEYLSTTLFHYPKVILTNIDKLSTSINHVIAQKKDGVIFSWGSNQFGQLGHSFNKSSNVNPPVKRPTAFMEFNINGYDSLSGSSSIDKYEERDYETIQDGSLFSDPIDTASGAMLYDKMLLKSQRTNPLDFSISYHSLLTKPDVLGNGWNHPYETKLIKISDNKMKVQWNSNSYTTFDKSSGNIFKPTKPNDKYEHLKNDNNKYQLTFKTGKVLQFNQNGQLESEKYYDHYVNSYIYGASGQLEKVVQKKGEQVVSELHFEYNTNQLITKVSDMEERFVTFEYNDLNHLISYTDANQNKTSFTYNQSGQMLTGTDPNGILFLKNEYDQAGRIVKQFDSYGNTSTLEYDEKTKPDFIITKTTNREGHTNTVVHDKNFNLVEETNALGQKMTYTYDNKGNMLTRTDANGFKTTMKYDANSNLIETINSSQYVLKMNYDPKHNMTNVIVNGVQMIQNEFNQQNELISTTDSNGFTTEYVYENGLIKEKIEPDQHITKFEYTNGLLSKFIDPEGNQTVYETDQLGRIIKQIDPNGNETKFTYDSNHNELTVTNPLQQVLKKTYDSHNELLSIVDYKGILSQFSYDDNGSITSTKRVNQEEKYMYDKEDRLIHRITPSGYQTSTSYDAAGKVIEEIDLEGVKTVFKYDNVGNLISKKTGEAETIFEYDTLNNLISITNAEGHKNSYIYNVIGQRIFVRDAKGGETSYEYDFENQLTSQTNAGSFTTSYKYDAYGNIKKIEDPNGNINEFSYDKNNRLIETKNALGQTNQYTYDKNGNLIQSFDALGHVTTREYDSLNRLIKTIDANGHSRSLTYDELGNIKTVTDGKGQVIFTTEYDEYSNPISVQDALGHTISQKVDLENNVIEIIDELNRSNHQAYNKVGQVTTHTDASGSVSAASYNKYKQTESIIDANGNETTFIYDKLGQLLQETNATGNKLTYEYDELGLLTKATNARQQSHDLVYDLIGQLIESNTAEGKTEYSYDGNGNVTMVVRGNETISRTYDQLNRVVEYTDHLGNTIGYIYDEVGNLKTLVYPDGKEVHYTYDPVGNMTSVTDWHGKQTKYVYDENNLLIQTIRPNGTIEERSYDAKGQLISISDVNTNNRMVYDEVGNVVQDAYGKYEYDHLNRLISHEYTDTTTNENETVLFSFDKVGNLLSYNHEDAQTEIPTADIVPEKEVIVPEVEPVAPVVEPDVDEISQNGTENSEEQVETLNATENENEIGADSSELTTQSVEETKETDTVNEEPQSDEVVEEVQVDTETNAETEIQDDEEETLAEENTTPEEQDTTVTQPSISYSKHGEFTYGADNQILTYNDETLTFDADGNLLSIPVRGELQQATYDSQNKLTQLGDTQYEYNAENKRVSITEKGTKTQFVVDSLKRLDQVLVELDANNQATNYYVYGLGLVSKEDSQGHVSYYHFDKRGSTTFLTDASGEVTDSYRYTIYGELIEHVGDAINRYLFNGKYGVASDENGLYYMRTRYYQPEIKRFINRDVVVGSISDPQTFNRYAYVNGNPVSYIDPFGMSREEDQSVLKSVYNFFIGDDINVLMDPKASALEKVFAGVSIASNFIPGGTVLKGGKLVTKGAATVAKKEVKYSIVSKVQSKVLTVDKKLECNCFIAGTKVLTDSGEKDIKDVKIGDKVLAKNDITNEQDYKEVLHLFKRVVFKTYTLFIGDEEITTTDEHPFWVVNKGWVEAQYLNKGDLLITATGNNVVVDDIIINNKPEIVYNFEVKDFHSYFVSNLGIWTHNACIWDLKPFVRGNIIEKKLAETDYRDWYNIGQSHGGYFPVIDFQRGKDVVSLKTLDPRLSSHVDNGSINKIKEYIDDLNLDIKVDGELANRILDVRVPTGTEHLISKEVLENLATDNKITLIIKNFDW